MRAMRPLFLAALASAALAAGPAVAAPFLAPHRAVYDLDLDRTGNDTSISGLTGRMVYEFNGSPCEGYTVTFRFVTQFDTGEASQVTDQQTTTYEEGDGQSFRFATKSFVDSNLEKEVRGAALLKDEGMTVTFQKPQKAPIELEKTQFPTQHLIELLRKAEAGETFYETTIFDGSEEADRVLTTTVIIGKKARISGNDPEREALDDLGSAAFWPVNIAYFDQQSEGGEELPVYQISFKLYDNGVTRDLAMDYGEFAMTGRLVDLSMLEAPKDCPQQ